MISKNNLKFAVCVMCMEVHVLPQTIFEVPVIDFSALITLRVLQARA